MIGLCAGILCYMAVSLKNRLGWDDALDVWGVHGVGGALGIGAGAALAVLAFAFDRRWRLPWGYGVASLGGATTRMSST